jgi:hypothetical protein
MVIVDEAHHARVHRQPEGRTTRLYRVVRELVSPDAFSKRAALFLTATPMQLDSGELYSLIELLDPALFPTDPALRPPPRGGAGPEPAGPRTVDSSRLPGPRQRPDEVVERVCVAGLRPDEADGGSKAGL